MEAAGRKRERKKTWWKVVFLPKGGNSDEGVAETHKGLPQKTHRNFCSFMRKLSPSHTHTSSSQHLIQRANVLKLQTKN